MSIVFSFVWDITRENVWFGTFILSHQALALIIGG
jgi:hypothetical protein